MASLVRMPIVFCVSHNRQSARMEDYRLSIRNNNHKTIKKLTLFGFICNNIVCLNAFSWLMRNDQINAQRYWTTAQFSDQSLQRGHRKRHRICKVVNSVSLWGRQDANESEKVTGVTLKLAFDQNWGVAELKQGSTIERFTSPSSLDMVHRLRRDSDCVLVGKSTVIQDNCSLTVRRVAPHKKGETEIQPTRVILDSKLSLLPSDDNNYKQYKIFTDGYPTIVFFSMQALPLSEQVQMQLLMDSSSGCIAWNRSVLLVNHDAPINSCVSPDWILKDLKQRGFSHIMIEGGPFTARAFLSEKLVDRAILIKAPISFEEPLLSEIDNLMLENTGLIFLGSRLSQGDVIEYWSRPGCPWPVSTIDADSSEQAGPNFEWP